MSEKAQKLLIVILFAAGISAYIGYDFGRRGYDIAIKNNPPRVEVINKVPQVQTVDFSLLWQVFELLNQKSLFRPMEAKKALYGAVKGLTESLDDPYTAFLPPDQNEAVNSSLEGKYEGIGAELGMKNSQLLIVAPLDDSPAKAANIRSGDGIIKIDGKETSGISLTEAVSKIRGKAGTKVNLTLIRDGVKDSFEVSITRASITVQSVKWSDKGEGVAYVRISRFGESTNKEWDETVAEIGRKVPRLRGIVLDVRYNPGGYLQSAIHVASEFVRTEAVVFEEFADGRRTSFPADHKGRFLDTPVAVLMNKGSASASEILAGALRDLRRAKIVGEKSYGKGSVQDTQNFPDGSGIHITIARWLTPKGTSINGQGLEPDVKIEVKDEEITEEKDSQIDAALKVVRSD